MCNLGAALQKGGQLLQAKIANIRQGAGEHPALRFGEVRESLPHGASLDLARPPARRQGKRQADAGHHPRVQPGGSLAPGFPLPPAEQGVTGRDNRQDQQREQPHRQPRLRNGLPPRLGVQVHPHQHGHLAGGRVSHWGDRADGHSGGFLRGGGHR